MKQKLKEHKGITLVALILTIIVLLILAVVAISAVKGDGIISHAKNARDLYAAKSEEENALLQNYLEILNNAQNNNTEEDTEDTNVKEVAEDKANVAIISENETKYYDNEAGAAKILKDGESLKLLGEINKNIKIAANNVTVIIEKDISGNGKIINNGNIRIVGQGDNLKLKVEIENNGTLNIQNITIDKNITNNAGTLNLSNITALNNNIIIKAGQAIISVSILNNITVYAENTILERCSINKVVNNGGIIALNDCTTTTIEKNSGTINRDGEAI